MNIKSFHLPRLASASIFLFTSVLSSAAILETDWKTVGDRLLLWDTATGLEWLKLGQTTDMSFDAVSSQLTTTYSGFRYAETADVWTFFDDAGVNPHYPAPPTPASSLSSLWGITYADFHSSYAVTATNNPFDSSYKLVAIVGWATTDGSVWFANATGTNILPNATSLYETNQHFGSALLRPYSALAVPEPETYLMFLSGIIVVGARLRSLKLRGIAINAA